MGRHIWEVEVGDRKQWHVVVCRENLEKKCRLKIAQEWILDSGVKATSSSL